MFVAFIFGALTVAGRLVEHAPNFTPVGALALWSGAYLPRRYMLAVPLGVMLATDWLIGFYNPIVMAAVYLCFALSTLLGSQLRQRISVGPIALSTVAGSLLFFIFTNFAVWLESDWYSRSLTGLVQCYLLAVPFFRNTLTGDVVFSTAFFGMTIALPYARRYVAAVVMNLKLRRDEHSLITQ